DIRLSHRRNPVLIALAAADDVPGAHGLPLAIQQPRSCKPLVPDIGADMRKNAAQRGQQTGTIVRRRNGHRFVVIVGLTARKRTSEPLDLFVALRDPTGHMLGRSSETAGARLSGHVVRVLLVGLRERALTHEALRGAGFLQTRIQTHPLIEYEALALVV